MSSKTDEEQIIENGRLLLLYLYSQDRDLYPGVDCTDWEDADYINFALSEFSAEERTALADWLERKLTSEESAHLALYVEWRNEFNPKRWTDPRDASKTGALAMGRYLVNALHAGSADV